MNNKRTIVLEAFKVYHNGTTHYFKQKYNNSATVENLTERAANNGYYVISYTL